MFLKSVSYSKIFHPNYIKRGKKKKILSYPIFSKSQNITFYFLMSWNCRDYHNKILSISSYVIYQLLFMCFSKKVYAPKNCMTTT